MSKTVHILSTCRNTDLLPYSLLVFDSLRVGFPHADVTVHINKRGMDEDSFDIIKKRAALEGCDTVEADTIHHEWIEQLVKQNSEPFWICDTDVVFHGEVEGWEFSTPLAGRRIPEWDDEFTKCITRSRLHTSLMHINPVEVRAAIKNYNSKLTETEFAPPCNLFHPLRIPFNSRTYFHDTTSLLYHAIGGQPLTPLQLDCFSHFDFGTISDLVLTHLSNREDMAEKRDHALHNPELTKGEWRRQEEYYQSRKPALDGTNVIAPIKKDDAEVARKWNIALCNGNAEAMDFCDLWYNYCHGIDDLIDTMNDGRPRMSRDQMIDLFWHAALLYNSPFYKTNSQLLFPVVLTTTNNYSDSVAWEQASAKHLRAMGDVMRTCGNEIYKMVALICGGRGHMQQMGRLIMERDWLGQHDKDGNPE